MYHIFFIHSSDDGHLGCFHVLAVVHSAAVNIGVHVSFQLMDEMLFLILDKSMVRKTPQLEKTMLQKTESSSFSALKKKSPVSV